MYSNAVIVFLCCLVSAQAYQEDGRGKTRQINNQLFRGNQQTTYQARPNQENVGSRLGRCKCDLFLSLFLECDIKI